MMIKKHAATLFFLMVAGLAGLVNAQTSNMLAVQVPFAFVVNGTTMPAGNCKIAFEGVGRSVLSIGSGTQRVYVVPIPDGSPNGSKATALVFHRYGRRYFLAGIKRAGATGYELPASRQEGELRAQNVSEEVLTLVASAK